MQIPIKDVFENGMEVPDNSPIGSPTSIPETRKLHLINFHPRDERIIELPDGGYKIRDTENYNRVTSFLEEIFGKFDIDKIVERRIANEKMSEERVSKACEESILKYLDKHSLNSGYWSDRTSIIKEELQAEYKKAADDGTELHDKIENFWNRMFERSLDGNLSWNLNEDWDEHQGINYFSKDYTLFLNFVKDRPYLYPYRLEWSIYADFPLMGRLDGLFIDTRETSETREFPEIKYVIYDWKRSKNIKDDDVHYGYCQGDMFCHIPNSSYWKATYQVNLYKYILERYYDIKIADMFILCLHPSQENYVEYKAHHMDFDMETFAGYLEKKGNL